MSYDRTRLRARLIVSEALKLRVYRCTAGKLSIGVGRNLDDVGISAAETAALGITVASCKAIGITKAQAMVLLDHDIDRAEADLDRALPWWRTLDAVRQSVLVDMCFNMGLGNRIKGLLSFVNTLALVQAHNFKGAAGGMLSSKWAKQVGDRAVHLAVMMETGKEPT
jgi:lysozyme